MADITNWTTGVDAISLEDVKLHMVDGALSPMILTGGVISEGTAGTVTISALTALLRTTDSAMGVLAYVTLAEQANQTMAAAGTKYHVVLDYNSNSPQILIQEAAANGTTMIGIGICMKDTSDPVKTHFQNSGMRLQSGVAKLHTRAATLRHSELASGCAISDKGGDTRQFNIASGVVYHGIHRLTPFADAPYNPYNSNDDKFYYVYRDGADSWSITADQTVISNTQYYDGAYGLGTLATNTYACHWVYIHPNENHVYVVYGTSHGKLAVAEQEFAPSDLPIELADFGLLLGCIIIKKDATAFTTIQMVTDTFFTGTAVADHGHLAGLTEDDHTQYVLATGARAMGELILTPKSSSASVTEGTMFYDADDNSIWVATE